MGFCHLVDGKSTSAKSGLEFTTPGFPAPHRLTSRLSAHHQHHGNTTVLRPQPPASTAFPRASGSHSHLRQRHGNMHHMKHSHSSKPCSAVPRAPLSSHHCPPHLPSLHLPSCFRRGREVNTCPMQTAAQRGERAPSPLEMAPTRHRGPFTAL